MPIPTEDYLLGDEIMHSHDGGDIGSGTIDGAYLPAALGALTVADTATIDLTLAADQLTADVKDDSITYAKIQNVSATSRILGRITALAGDVEELTAANVRTIINVADGANAYVHPNHSGEVTSAADGAQTIATGAVTLAKMADMATASFLGRNTALTGVPEVLSAATVKTMLSLGSAAYTASTDYLAAGAKAADSNLLDGHDTAYFQVAGSYLVAADLTPYSTKLQADALYAPISVTQYTDELAQDAVGGVIGTGLAYDDLTGAISCTITQYTDALAVSAVGTPWTGMGYYIGDGSAFATAAQGSLADTALQSVTTHDLLSATHGDTTASTVERGDLIVGTGATPKWDNLAIGTAGKALVSDGTDVGWSTSALGTAAFTASTAYAAALGADDNYVTDAEKIVIGNTSGTNTGDNATNSQYSGLAASKADVGQTFYIGTTQVAINRVSAALTLAGLTLTTPNIGVATGTSFVIGANTLDTNEWAVLDGINSSQFSYMESGLFLDTLTAPKLLLHWFSPSDNGTEVDLSGQGHNATYADASDWTAGDRVKKGLVWSLDFDGTNDFLTLADHDDFSFGDGSTDVAFSMGGWIEVVASTGDQAIMSKYNGTTGTTFREWYFYLTSTETIRFIAIDESTGRVPSRITDSAVSEGWHYVVVTYTPASGSGATFSNGITIYVDGVAVASTATNQALYVAMENLTVVPNIGSLISSGGTQVGFWKGDMGAMFITKETLSAETIWKQYISTRGYYNLLGE